MANKEAKTAKKYQPTRLEVAKTVVIAVLVTGIIAFIGGIAFANSQNEEVARAVEKVQAQTLEAEDKQETPKK